MSVKSHSLYSLSRITYPALDPTILLVVVQTGVYDLHTGSVSVFLCSVGFWSEAKHITSFLSILSAFYLRTSPASFCLLLYVQGRVLLKMVACLG